jgi:hypothetical protein
MYARGVLIGPIVMLQFLWISKHFDSVFIYSLKAIFKQPSIKNPTKSLNLVKASFQFRALGSGLHFKRY